MQGARFRIRDEGAYPHLKFARIAYATLRIFDLSTRGGEERHRNSISAFGRYVDAWQPGFDIEDGRGVETIQSVDLKNTGIHVT